MSDKYEITVEPHIDGWGMHEWLWTVEMGGRRLRTDSEYSRKVALRAARKFIQKQIADAKHKAQPTMKETYP